MDSAAPSRATVASNGEVQRLTDYEVLRFLQLRRQVRDAGGSRDVHAALVAAGGLSALSGSGTNVMNQKEIILNRIGEVKWVSKMAQRYLLGTPAALQTRDGIAQAVETLRVDNKEIGSSLRLTEGKKLSLINTNAGSQLLVSVCLGEALPLRKGAVLGPYDHSQVASHIAAALPSKAGEVAAAHATAVAKAQAAAAAAAEAVHAAATDEERSIAEATLADARAVAAAVAADVPPAVHEWKTRARHDHRDGRDGRDARDREHGGHGSHGGFGGHGGHGGAGHGHGGGGSRFPAGGSAGSGAGSGSSGSGSSAGGAGASGAGAGGAKAARAPTKPAAPSDPLALPAFIDPPLAGLTELLVDASAGHAAEPAAAAAPAAAAGGSASGVDVGQKRKRGASVAAAPSDAGAAAAAPAAASSEAPAPAAGGGGRGRGRGRK